MSARQKIEKEPNYTFAAANYFYQTFTRRFLVRIEIQTFSTSSIN